MIRSIIEQALRGRNGSREAEVLLERVGWGDGGASPGAHVDAVDRLKAELDRARRYERALAIAVLSAAPSDAATAAIAGAPKPGASNGNGRHAPTVETELPQVVSLLAVAVLQEILRASDVLWYQHATNRLVLALTEAEEANARRALERIEGVLRRQLRIEVRGGVARFPGDGLTLEDLISAAAARTEASRNSRSD